METWLWGRAEEALGAVGHLWQAAPHSCCPFLTTRSLGKNPQLLAN